MGRSWMCRYKKVQELQVYSVFDGEPRQGAEVSNCYDQWGRNQWQLWREQSGYVGHARAYCVVHGKSIESKQRSAKIFGLSTGSDEWNSIGSSSACSTVRTGRIWRRARIWKKNNNWRARFCVDQFEVILRDVRKTSRDVRDRDVHFTRPRRSN